jgi:hypothetical protein
MRRRGAADRLGADLGQADVPHVPRLHELADRADGLLDRHLGVQARRAIDVDVLDAQPVQAVRERGLDRGRARVIAEPGAVRPSLGPELDAQQEVLPRAAADRLADQHLVVAHAVEVAGVEERDPGVERGVDRGDALAPLGRPVHARHAHASEAERRDLRAVAAELACVDRGHGSRVARPSRAPA